MRRLELKDIAGYLPYSLRCHAMGEVNEDNNSILHKLTALDIDGCDIFADIIPCNDDTFSSVVALEDVFPILHPMSDITKEIVIEGYNNCKPFIPLDHLMDKGFRISEFVFVSDTYLGDNCSVDRITYLIRLLHSWHFDTFDLIGEGLAIDINTIRK